MPSPPGARPSPPLSCAEAVAAHPHRVRRSSASTGFLGVRHSVWTPLIRGGRGGRLASGDRLVVHPAVAADEQIVMVPWPAAETRSGQAWARAPKQTSATRWLTSTCRRHRPRRAGGNEGPAGATIDTAAWLHRWPERRIGGRPQGERHALTVTASTAFTLPPVALAAGEVEGGGLAAIVSVRAMRDVAGDRAGAVSRSCPQRSSRRRGGGKGARMRRSP